METIHRTPQVPPVCSVMTLNSLAVLLAMFWTASCPAVFCQEAADAVQGIVANDAASPVQIESVKLVPTDSNLPPQVAARSLNFDVTVVNTTPQATMLLGISYEFVDPSGGTRPSRLCFSTSTFDPATPPLPPSASKALHVVDARPSNAKLTAFRPTVDLVLLDDGRYYGKDVCASLEPYQSLLQDRGVYAGVLLNYLQTHGGDQTLEFLRKEVARRDSTDRLLLNPRKMNGQKVVVEKTE